MADQDPNAMTWYERLRRKRTRDIRLPSEGGRDPRLASPIPRVMEGLKGFKKMQENLEKAASQKRNDARGNQYRKSQKDAIMKGLMEGY